MRKSFKSMFGAVVVSVFLVSCGEDKSGGDSFSVDQAQQGIFRMDLSTASVSEQFGYKNYELMSDADLKSYFNRLKSVNFRKLNDHELLVDNYNFSKKVDLVRSGDDYSFMMIYSPSDTSGLQIILQGDIHDGRLNATNSVLK